MRKIIFININLKVFSAAYQEFLLFTFVEILYVSSGFIKTEKQLFSKCNKNKLMSRRKLMNISLVIYKCN